MRRALLLAGLGLVVSPVHSAAAAPAAAPVPAARIDTAPADAAGPEAQIEALRERLLASQQTIATLERELADEKNRAVAFERCRVKNGRLVRIGRQLVEGYEARWRKIHKDPFQLGRRRFEFEMQALSEALYDAQNEVPVKPAPESAPAADQPAATPAAPKQDPAPSAAPESAAPATASKS